MKFNKNVLKTVAVFVIIFFFITTAAEAVINNYEKENNQLNNEPGISFMGENYVWEDSFSNAQKIDLTLSENYTVEDGKVKMINTYPQWTDPAWKRMKIISFSLYFFLLVIFPFSASSQPSLKLGSLLPFTGRWGDSRRECIKGMLDASKWLNQRGGIFGMKLEVILMEDSSQTAETVAAFRKLNETDQILLLYIYSMETALALLPHIQFNRIPTLAGFLPSHLDKPLKYPFIFSVNPTALDLSKIAMKFIFERSGIKVRKPKIIFIGSPDLSSRNILEEAKEYAKKMGLDIGPDIWVYELSSPPAFFPVMQSYNPDFAYLSLSSRETWSKEIFCTMPFKSSPPILLLPA